MTVPQSLIQYLIDKANKCELCPLADNRKIIFDSSTYRTRLNPIDEHTEYIIFVTDAPSDTDYIMGRLLSDESGKFFHSLIQEHFPGQFEYIILSCVNCVPWTNKEYKHNTKAPSASECKTCSSNHLRYFLQALHPTNIFALGKIAERTLKTLNVASHTLPHPNSIYYSNHRELEIKRLVINLRTILDAKKEVTT